MTPSTAGTSVRLSLLHGTCLLLVGLSSTIAAQSESKQTTESSTIDYVDYNTVDPLAADEVPLDSLSNELVTSPKAGVNQAEVKVLADIKALGAAPDWDVEGIPNQQNAELDFGSAQIVRKLLQANSRDLLAPGKPGQEDPRDQALGELQWAVLGLAESQGALPASKCQLAQMKEATEGLVQAQDSILDGFLDKAKALLVEAYNSIGACAKTVGEKKMFRAVDAQLGAALRDSVERIKTALSVIEVLRTVRKKGSNAETVPATSDSGLANADSAKVREQSKDKQGNEVATELQAAVFVVDQQKQEKPVVVRGPRRAGWSRPCSGGGAGEHSCIFLKRSFSGNIHRETSSQSNMMLEPIVTIGRR